METQTSPTTPFPRVVNGRRINPTRSRDGETIGGGFFVVRRGRRTARIRPAYHPFEHPTFESAAAEAQKLAAQNPGQKFDVLAVVTSFREIADLPELVATEAAE
ncbi:MAG: hypothetical protein KDK08_28015 [Rhizobiaceae bacterium]|nr:hypothetical protein [Rhizobiaceae bacterium]